MLHRENVTSKVTAVGAQEEGRNLMIAILLLVDATERQHLDGIVLRSADVAVTVTLI